MFENCRKFFVLKLRKYANTHIINPLAAECPDALLSATILSVQSMSMTYNKLSIYKRHKKILVKTIIYSKESFIIKIDFNRFLKIKKENYSKNKIKIGDTNDNNKSLWTLIFKQLPLVLENFL